LANGIPSTITNEQAFYSSDYDKVTHKHILKICRQRFFGQDSSIGRGKEKVRALTFDKEIVDKVGNTFEVVDKIEILEEPRAHDTIQDEDDTVWGNYNNINAKDIKARVKVGTKGRKLVSTEDKEIGKTGYVTGQVDASTKNHNNPYSSYGTNQLVSQLIYLICSHEETLVH
jgi:hypothetical protein